MQKKSSAFSYLIKGSKPNKAIFVIPGSGLNQSTEILTNNKNNYHYPINTMLKQLDYDSYIFIKPNEDILAFHNSQFKINESFFVNYLLNKGYSYSAHYINQSIAFTYYLKKTYSEVILIGLSQGAIAALLNSLKTNVSNAVIASGYTVLSDEILWSDHNQIIIPNYQNIFSKSQIKKDIRNSDTNYLFTYGLQDNGPLYLDAYFGYTCNFFSELPNVSCYIHKKGHKFPTSKIVSFLEQS